MEEQKKQIGKEEYSLRLSFPGFIAQRDIGTTDTARSTNVKDLFCQVMADPGEPLPPPLSRFMEDCLGARFSDVRIHRSAASDAINQAYGSLAFTVYNQIGLRSWISEEHGNLFNYVLAHELVHVMQKRRTREQAERVPLLCILEEEARRAAYHALHGRRPTVSAADTPAVPRFWGPAGHYWTVYLVSMLADWRVEDSFLNAFYAQLPDQVEELDATAAGFDYYEQPDYPRLRDDPEGPFQRDTYIQRGLHALTGRAAELETSIRTNILKKLKRGSFEYGLALHPFGDSFAHRNGNVMYVAHLGHFVEVFHFKNPHNPDRIHKRGALYERYGLAMFEILGAELSEETRKEKRLKLQGYLREIARERDEDSQIEKIDSIVLSERGLAHLGPRLEKEELVPWEEFLRRHPFILSSDFLRIAQGCARSWAWYR